MTDEEPPEILDHVTMPELAVMMVLASIEHGIDSPGCRSHECEFSKMMRSLETHKSFQAATTLGTVLTMALSKLDEKDIIRIGEIEGRKAILLANGYSSMRPIGNLVNEAETFLKGAT